MTDQSRINGHASAAIGEGTLIAVALLEQFQITPNDDRLQIGIFTTTTTGSLELRSRRLRLPDLDLAAGQRLARIINTVTDDGHTIREQAQQEAEAPVLAWWMAGGYADRPRLVVAVTPTGVWYDAAADHADGDPTICRYNGGEPSGIDAIVECLRELAFPVTLQHQTTDAWVASETRMCSCWHPFAAHRLDGPEHGCDQDCDCRRFASTEDHLPGRWVLDTPEMLATLKLADSCATAAHHTSPDGQHWYWVPDFLTRLDV
jgi:hypothetical protein